MVSFIMKNDILAMSRQGKSNREIAKILGISRNTVNKYVKEAKRIINDIEAETDQSKILELQRNLVSEPKRLGIKTRKVFTGDLEKRFYELIKLDEQRDLDLGSNKQKLSAAHLHRLLIAEGFKVGETTIRNNFRIYKDKKKEAFIRQSYNAGYRAEYDFHEVKVQIDGKSRIIYQATISLPYSNYKFVKHYEN